MTALKFSFERFSSEETDIANPHFEFSHLTADPLLNGYSLAVALQTGQVFNFIAA